MPTDREKAVVAAAREVDRVDRDEPPLGDPYRGDWQHERVCAGEVLRDALAAYDDAPEPADERGLMLEEAHDLAAAVISIMRNPGEDPECEIDVACRRAFGFVVGQAPPRWQARAAHAAPMPSVEEVAEAIRDGVARAGLGLKLTYDELDYAARATCAHLGLPVKEQR